MSNFSTAVNVGNGTAVRSTRARAAPSFAFQPYVDTALRQVIGHEALLRGPGGEPARHMLAQVPDEELEAPGAMSFKGPTPAAGKGAGETPSEVEGKRGEH